MATKTDKARHGGARPGAGRPKGTKNLRTIAATELLAEAQEKFPDFNPITALIALAQSAMAEDAEKPDPILAKDCLTAVLPYMAAKFRPIEADIDRVVDLEAKLARVKLEAQAQLAQERPEIWERLERAAQREVTIVVETAVPRSPNDPALETIEGQLADRLARAGVTYAPPTPRVSPPEEPQDAPAAPSAGPALPAPAAPTAKPAEAPAPALAPPPKPYRPMFEAALMRFDRTMPDDYTPFSQD